MKIALVIERMFPQRGGRERSVAEIAAELVRRGHDVTVLCQEGSGGDGGVKVVALGRPRTLRLLALPRFGLAVKRFLDHERFEIVHATLPIPGANVYQPRGGTVMGNLLARCRRAPLLGQAQRLLARAGASRRALALRLEKAVVERKDTTILCVSRMVAEEIRRHYARTEGVRVIYSGVDVPQVSPEQRRQWRQEWRQRWGADDSTTVFLTVAENFRLKGVGEAIDGLARFAAGGGDAGAVLVVVGGDRAGPYQRRARRAGVADRVRFVGHVPDVFPLYSAADAVVLLSWYDACSRVVLEAIRWGSPSLTTQYNGASELVGEAGIVVESPQDTAAVAAAMAQLADPRQGARMAEACRAKADVVSLRRQVDELERVYSETRH